MPPRMGLPDLPYHIQTMDGAYETEVKYPSKVDQGRILWARQEFPRYGMIQIKAGN